MSAHPNPSLESRPRDFGAQFKRRRVPTLGLRLRRRHRGRRALVLFAAFAVPALAAPGDWDAFGIGNAGSADIAVEPLPFERPGESFPGSAFYYLAQVEAVRTAGCTLGQGYYFSRAVPDYLAAMLIAQERETQEPQRATG